MQKLFFIHKIKYDNKLEWFKINKIEELPNEKYYSICEEEIKDNIYKDNIEEFWKDKKVRFAYANNCVGCFHRNPVFLKHISSKSEKQYDWFVQQEKNSYDSNSARWKTGMTYEEIKNAFTQLQMFDDDFDAGDGCDSGYCGL